MNKKSICHYGFIPVRSEPAESSEMCTQVLFGETYEVLSVEGKWANIRLDFDGYEGWIDAKLDWADSDDSVESWKKADKVYVAEARLKITDENEVFDFFIPMGSCVAKKLNADGTFVMGQSVYRTTYKHPKDLMLSMLAFELYGTPYLWGGRTSTGIDCSGFAQLVYKIVGVDLPRDASQQVLLGREVSTEEELKFGDLAFFENDKGRIVHVGLCLGFVDKIIHASGDVHIDKLDALGIYSERMQKYTHKLACIRRLL